MRNGELIQVPAGTRWDEVADPTVDVPDEAIRRAEAARVRREVAALPQPVQSAVEMSFGLNGFGRALSARELGDQLGCSKVTAWRWRQQGLKLLRKAYGVEEEAEGLEVGAGEDSISGASAR